MRFSATGLGAVLIGAVMCLLLLAGVLKLVELDRFATAIKSWTLLPGVLRAPILVGAPVLEVVAGGAYLLRIGRRGWWVGVGIGLLVAYSAALWTQAALAEPPDCNCFGLLLQHQRTLEGVRAAIVRNGVLASLLAAGLFLRLIAHRLAAARVSRPIDRRPMGGIPSGSDARAFTVVEVLVAIVIVAILASLLVVGLRGSRHAAGVSLSLSNLRQHAQVFSAYSQSWEDAFPNVADPRTFITHLEYPELGVVWDLPYFLQFSTWDWFLARDWYQMRHNNPIFRDPLERPGENWPGYLYSCSFLADPLYWRATTRMSGLSQWRATRQHEVVWPARKTLIVMPAHSGIRLVRLAMVDGAAASLTDRAGIAPGYPKGDGQNAGSHHWQDMYECLHTIDGVRGWDLK